MSYRKKINSPFSSFTNILFLLLFFMALFFIARGVFWILSWVSPFLLIGALLLDYSVVLNYGKWLINLVKNKLLIGIVAIILTVIGFPVVAAFLFGKALFKKKLKDIKAKHEKEQQGEYVDYEELENKNTTLELPQMKPKEKQSEYDRLFDEEL
jgi:hypothetical protein